MVGTVLAFLYFSLLENGPDRENCEGKWKSSPGERSAARRWMSGIRAQPADWAVAASPRRTPGTTRTNKWWRRPDERRPPTERTGDGSASADAGRRAGTGTDPSSSGLLPFITHVIAGPGRVESAPGPAAHGGPARRRISTPRLAWCSRSLGGRWRGMRRRPRIRIRSDRLVLAPPGPHAHDASTKTTTRLPCPRNRSVG